MIDPKSKELYIPLSTIYGKPNPDGTYTLTALDIKNLNDNLYALAKKVQGGLTLADMTDGVNQEFSDMEGNVTQAQITAEGASITASNAYGKAQQVELTVDGFTVRNADGSTTIDGNKIKSGTIEGVILVSDNGLSYVELADGAVSFNYGGQFRGSISGGPYGLDILPRAGYPIQLLGDVRTGAASDININGSAVRITSSGNMSINSSGKTYIATNVNYSGDVDIGQAGGTINLIGNVRVNGNPI